MGDSPNKRKSGWVAPRHCLRLLYQRQIMKALRCPHFALTDNGIDIIFSQSNRTTQKAVTLRVVQLSCPRKSDRQSVYALSRKSLILRIIEFLICILTGLFSLSSEKNSARSESPSIMLLNIPSIIVESTRSSTTAS